jgi:hypothetical protein
MPVHPNFVDASPSSIPKCRLDYTEVLRSTCSVQPHRYNDVLRFPCHYEPLSDTAACPMYTQLGRGQGTAEHRGPLIRMLTMAEVFPSTVVA